MIDDRKINYNIFKKCLKCYFIFYFILNSYHYTLGIINEFYLFIIFYVF